MNIKKGSKVGDFQTPSVLENVESLQIRHTVQNKQLLTNCCNELTKTANLVAYLAFFIAILHMFCNFFKCEKVFMTTLIAVLVKIKAFVHSKL